MNISDVNMMRQNLRILATFTGTTGLTGKGARKLQIGNNGQFTTAEGYTAALFSRKSNDSLLDRGNVATIKNMFNNAINEMAKNSSPGKQFGLRKEIFDGLLGLIWLGYHGYRTRTGYQLLKSAIDEITKKLTSELASVVFGEKHTLWFNQPSSLFLPNTYQTQTNFLDDPQGGICYGISLEWCRRYIKGDKESLTQSSKDQQLEDEINAYKYYLKAESRKIQGISRQEQHKIYAEARSRFMESLREFNVAENRFVDRMKKKGKNMALMQNVQKTLKSDQTEGIVDAIHGLLNHRAVIQTELQRLQQRRNQSRNVSNQIGLDARIAKAQSSLSKFDASLAPFIPPGQILADVSPLVTKYENIMTQQLNRTELVNFCLKDYEDFLPKVSPLVDNCHNTLLAGNSLNIKTAFMLTWNASSFMDFKVSGHAMAFHRCNSNNYEYIVFDPNFGESLCTDINAVKTYFSVLFSFYSIDTNIFEIGARSITFSNPGP